MHKNFVSSLFGDQNIFNSTKEDFSSIYIEHVLLFRPKDKINESFGKDQIDETIDQIG
jgi:hypothetical protein